MRLTKILYGPRPRSPIEHTQALETRLLELCQGQQAILQSQLPDTAAEARGSSSMVLDFAEESTRQRSRSACAGFGSCKFQGII